MRLDRTEVLEVPEWLQGCTENAPFGKLNGNHTKGLGMRPDGLLGMYLA